MKINNVDFNQEWARSVTEKDFVEHLTKEIFQELKDAKREAELKKIYTLLTAPEKAPENVS